MNCRRFNKIVMDLVRHGFSSTQESQLAKEHAASCSKCANKLKQQQALQLLLKTAAGSPDKQVGILPDELREAFNTHHQDNKPAFSMESKLWAIAAVLLILGMAGALSFRLNQLGIQSSSSFAKSTTANERNTTSQIATEFFPLMQGEPSLETMQLIRVRLPRSTLLHVGLPMNESREEEPILADVLVSEEGLPYAIRFINDQQN
jgi:hypothetical protein